LENKGGEMMDYDELMSGVQKLMQRADNISKTAAVDYKFEIKGKVGDKEIKVSARHPEYAISGYREFKRMVEEEFKDVK